MVLGLLLVLLSGAAVVLLAAYNRSGGPDYSVNLLDREFVVANGLQIFFAGIALALLFCLGLWLMAMAARRSRAMRAEIRAARHDAKAAEAERDRLAGQVNEGRVRPDARYEEAPDATAPIHTGTEEPARRRFFARRHENERTPTPH
jgi:ABC-type nickel/cobalt efflux system permease component RcnA